MHVILAIYHTKHNLIKEFKSVNDGADIDHTSVAIKLAIPYIKSKHNAVINGVTDWTKIVNDEGFEHLYCETIKYIVDKSTLYDAFN